MYLILSPDTEYHAKVVYLDHAITPGDLYDLLDCEFLDFFSYDRYYVACDDNGATKRPINLLASLLFSRQVYGPVLIGLLHDPDLPFSDPDLYPLTFLDYHDICVLCLEAIKAYQISRSPEL